MMRSLASCRASSAAASAVVSSGYPIAIRSDIGPPSWNLAGSCSAVEQLGLGGGEFGVGQDALLMQGGELVQLVNHRRGLRRGRCGLIGLRRCLLLFELAEALVLVVVRLVPLLRPPTHAPSRDVRATAHHSRT